MNLWRCRICGETFLGTTAPSRCPFCGAAEALLVGPDGFDPAENHINTTELEQANLETAIETERSNARFYAAASLLGGDDTLASAFKRLARIEAEHCSVFAKLADVSKPADLTMPTQDGPGDFAQAISASVERETRAAELYDRFADESTNDRVREVFAALADVERDHLAVDAAMRGLLG